LLRLTIVAESVDKAFSSTLVLQKFLCNSSASGSLAFVKISEGISVFRLPAEALLISNQYSSFVGSVYCRNSIIKLHKIVKVSVELAAFKVNKNRLSDDKHPAIGHFRITLPLFFKASPSAQLFV